MQIICVRHGEACGPEIDSKRPLTERGRDQVNELACFLAKNGLSIQQSFHSGKLRAKQTADIFAKKLAIASVSELSLLENDQTGVEDLLDIIPSWTENTMIVGHLPFIPEFVNAIVLNKINHQPILHCPPATVICLEYLENAHWIIRWMLNPELLRSCN